MPLHHNLTSLYGGTGTLAMSGDGTRHTNTVVSIRSSKLSETVAMLQEAIEYLGAGSYTRTAEKAEQERDEARGHECSDLDAHWRLDETLASLKEANATVASLRAAQPRPLTADDITYEMVKRAQREEERQRGDWTAPTAMRHILTAALTDPPRPEGAEEMEALIGSWERSELLGQNLTADDLNSLADHLAERGVRVARRDEEKRDG